MLALHENERVIGVHRKTWVLFAFSGVSAFIAVLAPVVALSLVSFLPLRFPFSPPPEPALLFLSLWWWLVWIVLFFAFMKYYLDAFVLTNERVIRIEQISAFSRTVSELRLERIQDVTIEQHGVLATLLHFGDIRVQTAGESEEFLFTAIPHPVRVKEALMAAQRAANLRRLPLATANTLSG